MKRNFIKLVENVQEVVEKNAEPKFKTFVTPSFIPLRKIYDATDIQNELENNNNLTEREQMDMMLDMVVDIYGKQFTKNELLEGLHSPDAGVELMEQMEWVVQGKMDEARKKELAKMI
ncbi:phage tail assembly chaperone G [Macrococcoides canis]|uniref:phage tail assembly chaperone G n=1 Tax=Macrococcoides canis TaxID=1855823 RepID=UPI00105D571A|nr:hypothetical protein [Macrococcus canis]TDM35190.1 hypothetical protein ETI13_05270 [Macrococcus canis]